MMVQSRRASRVLEFGLRSLCGLLLVLAVVPVGVLPAAAATRWHITDLGEADGGSEVAWSPPEWLAWRLYDESGRSALFAWNVRTRSRLRLCKTPGDCYDRDLMWQGGRLYWLREVYLTPGGSLKRCEILSMAPHDPGPKTLLSRKRIGVLLGGGGQLVWTEALRGAKDWSVFTSRRTNGRPRRLSGFGPEPADLRLSDKMLAWASKRTPRVIKVLPVGATGRFAKAPTGVAVGGTRASKYEPGSLSLDGDRIAWSVRDGTGEWRVFSWALDESTPTSAGFLSANQQVESLKPVVSGQRVAWSVFRNRYSADGGAYVVSTWAVGESSPTIIAEYAYPRYEVSIPTISDDTVAWLRLERGPEIPAAMADVGRTSTSTSTILEWRPDSPQPQGFDTPEAVYGAETSGVAIRGNRIAFRTPRSSAYDNWLYLAERIDARTTTPSRPSTTLPIDSGVESRRARGIRLLLITVTFFAAICGVWILVLVRRRRHD